MPGITDPAEEYFKDGLWGWVTSAWEKLVADASGFLKINVAAQDIDVEVKQTAPADLTPGVCGWDGSAWHKLPLVWGFSGIVEEALSDTNLGAGVNYLQGTTVPAGEIWVITLSVIRYAGTVPTDISLNAGGLATGMPMLSVSAPTSAVWYFCDRQMVLQVGDNIYGYVGGATAGDDLLVRYSGYKMKIAE